MTTMNIAETLAFIQEADWKGSVLGLSRVRELLDRLGNPQKRLKFIHVAGTNGKGSVCAMLSSILAAAGYRTGLCISPHLDRYNERMQVDGVPVSDEELCRMAELVLPHVRAMEDAPTEFERVLAMCLMYFVSCSCDIVVLEVGLGGRLDATNVIDPPLLCLITNISLDHTVILGDTIEKIAREKGGIIKKGTRAVMANQSRAAIDVIAGICRDMEVPLDITFLGIDDYDYTSDTFGLLDLGGQEFNYRHRRGLKMPLVGTYQIFNAALVLDGVDALNLHYEETKGESGIFVSEEAVRTGLGKVSWPGRFEVLSRHPLVVVDGAHNPQGVDRLSESIKRHIGRERYGSVIFVMSVMEDKDYDYLIEKMAPYAGEFIAVAPDYYRAIPPDRLAGIIRGHTDCPVRACENVTRGVEKALDLCREREARGESPCVVAFGSLYQVAEVRRVFGRE